MIKFKKKEELELISGIYIKEDEDPPEGKVWIAGIDIDDLKELGLKFIYAQDWNGLKFLVSRKDLRKLGF